MECSDGGNYKRYVWIYKGWGGGGGGGLGGFYFFLFFLGLFKVF